MRLRRPSIRRVRSASSFRCRRAVRTLPELVAYSKKNPDKLNFASMGLGGDTHLMMEWLKHATGAKIVHVPFKGFPEAMTSFKGNEVQLIALLVGNPDLARQVRD